MVAWGDVAYRGASCWWLCLCLAFLRSYSRQPRIALLHVTTMGSVWARWVFEHCGPSSVGFSHASCMQYLKCLSGHRSSAGQVVRRMTIRNGRSGLSMWCLYQNSYASSVGLKSWGAPFIDCTVTMPALVRHLRSGQWSFRCQQSSYNLFLCNLRIQVQPDVEDMTMADVACWACYDTNALWCDFSDFW